MRFGLINIASTFIMFVLDVDESQEGDSIISISPNPVQDVLHIESASEITYNDYPLLSTKL